MNNAEAVGFREHVADVRGDADGTFGRKASLAREHFGERRAFDELHDDEVAAIGQIARVEDHRGVRVAQLRHRARFAHEAFGHIAGRRQTPV